MDELPISRVDTGMEHALPALRLGSLKNTRSPGCSSEIEYTRVPRPLCHWLVAEWGRE